MKSNVMAHVRRARVAILAAGLWTGGASAQVETWPAWRGADMSGAADGSNLPTEFGETLHVRWKIPTPGEGESTPILWGDRLFLCASGPAPDSPDGRVPDGAEGKFQTRIPKVPYAFEVICLNRHTGEEIWRTRVRRELPHEGAHPDHGFASASPVTDGEHVWAWFGSRGLYCLTMDGAIRWQRDLDRMFMRVQFGEASSPTLVGRAIVVLMDHEEDSSIAAVDKNTGGLLWRKPRNEGSSWTTPVAVSHGGTTQIVVNGTNHIRAYDPETGDVLWQCSGQTTNVIPSPVAGFGRVYCASGFRGAALQAIELGRTGELTGTDAIHWEYGRDTPYVSSPLLYGRRIYFLDGTQPKLTCLDAETGRVHYAAERIDEIRSVYASPLGADGRIFITGRNGVIAVIRDADTFEVLALNRFDDAFDASPAVAGRDMYLRGKKNLYCIRAE